MSKHQQRVRTARDIQADRIRDRVAELTEPHVEVVSQWVPDRDAGRLVQRETRIEHPSLLGQLLGGVTGATAGAASSTPASKPAANLEPISVVQDIAAATETWIRVVDPARAARPDMRSVVGRLWRLVDRAPTLTDERLRNLDGDVMRWWVSARTVTTWGDAPYRPHVPCPECGRWGRINVRLYPTTAVCLECGTAWDQMTIGTLGNHVQIMLEQEVVLGGPVEGPELPASLVAVPRRRSDASGVLTGVPLA